MSGAQDVNDSVELWESAPLAAHTSGDSDAGSNRPATTIHRGMAVQTSEGCVAGYVAAVVLQPGQQEVTHVLLVQECRRLEYRLIPAALIQQVDEGQLLLRIFEPGLDSLPVWPRV